jgi:hypothetical protein
VAAPTWPLRSPVHSLMLVADVSWRLSVAGSSQKGAASRSVTRRARRAGSYEMGCSFLADALATSRTTAAPSSMKAAATAPAGGGRGRGR